MRLMIVLLALLAGCAAERDAGGISDEQFIATMVELRRAAQTAGPDTARFAALRDEVLAQQGVTERELSAYLASPERDLADLAEVWDSISARLTEEEAR